VNRKEGTIVKLRVIISVLLAAAVAASGWAQSATVVEVAGKVEFQAPGKAWKPAKVGDVIAQGSMVSTGFKSTTVLKIGAATITVKPITRLSLEQIVQNEAGSQTQLFLLAGRVKAEVQPQAGQTTDFQVKSPTATASVRGTGFEFDGVNLVVEHGSVRLMTPGGQFRFVGAGEFSTVTRSGEAASPAAVALGTGLDQIGDLLDQAASEAAADQGVVTDPGAMLSTLATITIIVE